MWNWTCSSKNCLEIEIDAIELEIKIRKRYYQSCIWLTFLQGTPNEILLTYFWVDNLGKKIDKGKRWWDDSYDSTCSFQENLVRAIKTIRKVANVPKLWCLSFINCTLLPLDISIDTKKEPPRFDSLADISYDIRNLANATLNKLF